MNKPMIIKCNRMFSDKELEELRQKWNNQAIANEVIVLPPGFELAEVNVELFEQIKAEIVIKELEKIKAEINKCPIEVDYPDIFINQEYVYKILNNHISELKGENK